MTSVAGASRLATGQDALDGSFVPRGVATPQGLDSGGSPAFVGVASVRGPRFLFCGDIQHDAVMLGFA